MKNKEKILEIIKKNNCGISASQVFDIVSGNMDKTTVYRNLEKLSGEGKINEEFSLNGEKKYSHIHHHHHHFICNNCEKKINVGCFFSRELNDLEKEEDIKIQNHSFLLNGLCKDCKN